MKMRKRFIPGFTRAKLLSLSCVHTFKQLCEKAKLPRHIEIGMNCYHGEILYCNSISHLLYRSIQIF